MESFYGGRQGNPFVIVKRFDGIDIPQTIEKPVFRRTSYALDMTRTTKDNKVYLKKLNDDNSFSPIIKTANNQFNYIWGIEEKDGNFINLGNDDGSSISWEKPYELAEGMKQCFEQRGVTTSEVNYGEYVLIDTATDMLEGEDKDNGKIFRRGVDFDNEFAGAEFIGCILGPRGKTPDLDMDSYTKIDSMLAAASDNILEEQIAYRFGGKGSYTTTSQDIVPGRVGDEFNDKIDYAWIDIRDESENLKTCLIGFKFPYLVLEFITSQIEPYNLPENLITRATDDTQEHPYYNKWHLKVPKGIHGADISNLEVRGQWAKLGSIYYQDAQCTIALGILTEDENRKNELQLLGASPTYGYLKYEGQNVYVKAADIAQGLVYTQTKYENELKGENTEICIGSYNMIKSINADDDGVITVEYTHDKTENLGKITFLLETLISEEGNTYNVPPHHLLVLLSNYAGDITYKSKRFNGQDITGYVDLGYIKGNPGPGLAILAKYDSVSDLPQTPSSIDGYQTGYGVIVGDGNIYIYDVNAKSWVFIGTIDNINPSNVIRFDEDEDILNKNGINFITSEIKFAE